MLRNADVESRMEAFGGRRWEEVIEGGDSSEVDGRAFF